MNDPGSSRMKWFADARLGLFLHYGVYSLLGRGEWTRNREDIPRDRYRLLARRFAARNFDADAIADLAVAMGARYVVLTTKHHDGFCLFDSRLTDFKVTNTPAGRDLVAEYVRAVRRRGLKVGLYYSLNDWDHIPSATDAWEDRKAHREFLDFTFAQLRQLLTGYGRIDLLWYDGCWPFLAPGWQAGRMNALARRLQPHIVINDRNGGPGDFATPEQHMNAVPDRPWEACMTLSERWSWTRGDTEFKSPRMVLGMLRTAANGNGNLLLNVAPRPDGSIPAAAQKILREVGGWIARNGESIRPGPMLNPAMEWTCCASFTARRNRTYLHMGSWPDGTFVLPGLSGRVTRAHFLHDGTPVRFEQRGHRLELSGLPSRPPDPLMPVIVVEHRGTLSRKWTGGTRLTREP